MKKLLEFLQNLFTNAKPDNEKDLENYQSDFTPTPTLPEDLDSKLLIQKTKKKTGRPKKSN